MKALRLPGEPGRAVSSTKAELVGGFQGMSGTALCNNIDRIKPPTELQGALGPCVAATKSRSVSISEAKPGFGAVSTALAIGPKAS